MTCLVNFVAIVLLRTVEAKERVKICSQLCTIQYSNRANFITRLLKLKLLLIFTGSRKSGLNNCVKQ